MTLALTIRRARPEDAAAIAALTEAAYSKYVPVIGRRALERGELVDLARPVAPDRTTAGPAGP
ncbi:MAG: hypothetical protein HKM95_14865 [Inquilinus sp.]|nr:hypothetical protein [Inquilinus sp.]